MNLQNEEIEIDLRELLFVLWHKVFLIIAATIIGAVAFGVVSYYFITPQYKSTSKIYIVNTTGEAILSLSDLQIGSNLTEDYTILIKSRPVVEKVISNLKLDMDYEEMLGMLSVSYISGTRVINIAITHPDATIAMEIANEFAVVTQKQIPEIMKTSEPSIVEEAVVGSRVSPNNIKNMMVGAILGLVLSAGIILVLYFMDDTIKNAEDIERYLGLNTLAAIPEEDSTDNREKHRRKSKLRGVRNVKGGVK